MFRTLYTAIVRPHLEYANQMWCSYLVNDIKLLENVQRRATRLVPELKGLQYTDRLKRLNLPTLAYRRSRGDMIETFKILRGFYDPACTTNIFTRREEDITRGNSYKLYKSRIRLNIKKNSSSSRVIDSWNSLPECVIQATTIQDFEKRLDSHWNNQDRKFDYRTPICLTRGLQCQSNQSHSSTDTNSDPETQLQHTIALCSVKTTEKTDLCFNDKASSLFSA